jgi:hypothetical protein
MRSLRGFGHGPIDAFPSPLQAHQVIGNGQSLSPEPFENPRFDPLIEVVIDGAGRAEAFPGDGLLVDSSAQHIEDTFFIKSDST